MKTRDALRQVTGRHVEYGDGPLGRVAQQLLERFDAREDARLLDAEERAAQVGKGPILDVLRRELARAKGAALFDNSLPMVTCWDAHQAMERAKSANPTDHGIRTAAAHVKRLWQKDMMGNLAVGDVARLRTTSGSTPSRVSRRLLTPRFRLSASTRCPCSASPSSQPR